MGMTGGIGMGKSTCAKLLAQVGVCVVDTDELAHSLTGPGQPALQEISQQFGSRVLDPSGCLNRSALAKIVFTDQAARDTLESILHPRIISAWKGRVEAWKLHGARAGVVVIPLLFETMAETHFDSTVCVACSPAAQKERLLQRGWTPDESASRIAAQLPIEEKMARANFVIWTEGEKSVLRPQLEWIFPVSK